MKKQILKKSIIDKVLAVGLLVLVFIMSAIKSEASIPNSYLTFSAAWSGNKCTATTEPDPQWTTRFCTQMRWFMNITQQELYWALIMTIRQHTIQMLWQASLKVM